MEVEAAKILFGRSLEKHGLRYTTMLCDGDSRAFNSLQEEKVYGFVPIEKEDCVNHIHKRMGAALRNLLQKSKGEGRPSLGGKGKLTAELVTKLTNYYGWALKAHQGNIDEMENAVLATYYHVTSTDTKPQHSRCPKGEESWCAHNKAVARQQAPPKHRYNLPEYVAEALLPVYTRLSDRKLLERCQRGKTQNSNESLHSVIWSLVPKTKHASLFTVETAVAEAVARFNAGKKRASEAILKELHLSQGSTDVERCLEKDQRRLAACDKKHTRAENFRNAMKRRRVKENDKGLTLVVCGLAITPALAVQQVAGKLRWWQRIHAKNFVNLAEGYQAQGMLHKRFPVRMAKGDRRLKVTTREAFGKRRKRPWNARPKAARPVMLPELTAAALSGGSAGSSSKLQPNTCGVSASSPPSSRVGADRIDTAFFTADESSERATTAGNVKARLASKSATERKFELLGVEMEDDVNDSGTEFLVVDLSVVQEIIGLMQCPECGEKTATLSKDPTKEYGLCVKLVLECFTCEMRAERFSSPRVAGDNRITPFEVNVRAMKAIQSIGKEQPDLSDSSL
ncbi:hypothetical protein HPB52_010718 [Rhipicephalus sanguineus]|uniref:Mutator-like transposase domain-containing protein n=1 Tax=Rhipicephalus sanguineus TaxID=34632 RepID=A0A9D4Q0B5_RHISA|nr:hypothetical protein HPB52_010718 [Rhipicephalus sanguineus]